MAHSREEDRIGPDKRERRTVARVYVDTEALKELRNQLWLLQSMDTLICEIDKGEHKGPSKLLVICEAEEVYRERLRNL